MSTATDILRTMNQMPGSLATLPPATPAKSTAGNGDAGQNLFAQIMQQHSIPGAASAGEASQDALTNKQNVQAEKAAGDLISNALILPMLKQLRRSPWSENTPFSPGIGEKTFGPQFDMQISDRIAHSPRLGIKNALAKRLIKRGQPNAASNANTSPNTPAEHGSLNVHG